MRAGKASAPRCWTKPNGLASRAATSESYQRGFYPKHGWIERDDAALFMYYFDEDE
jgi:hypothetical protein